MKFLRVELLFMVELYSSLVILYLRRAMETSTLLRKVSHIKMF